MSIDQLNSALFAATSDETSSLPTVSIYSEDRSGNERPWEVYRAALQGRFVANKPRRSRTSGISFDAALVASQPATLIISSSDRFDYLSRCRHHSELQQGQALLAQSDAQVDKVVSGQEAGYAKLALAKGSYATPIMPRISKSPEGGVALQTSTEKGTLNLIFEGGEAILIRATDNFAVQVHCNLTPESISELLDMYEIELSRIA